MISTATLHAVVGLLTVQAGESEATVERVLGEHNAEFRAAHAARALRLRTYATEIQTHLTAEALAAEYTVHVLSGPAAPSDESLFS